MTTRDLVAHTTCSALALVLTLASCGGATSGGREVTSSTSETVTATGATLLGPDGTEVTIPAGALSGSVTIVASSLAGLRAPRGAAVVGQAVRLGPSGTMFEKVVELTIPISPASLPAGTTIDDVVVLRAAQDSSVFVPLPTRRHASGAAVVAATEHFSDFVAVVVEAGANPFGACGDAMCVGGETCGTCPADCGVCVAPGNCGNGVCEPGASEACGVCAFDCGACTSGVCGDGVIDAGETCEAGFATGTLIERCQCDDGDPCTMDALLVGSPGACNVVCTHARLTGLGIDTCDDGLLCTVDVTGAFDPVACTLACTHAPLDVTTWGAVHCDDLDPCTTDVAVGYDSSTCATSSCDNQPIGGCTVVCGDGFINGAEVCDDGNATSTDGCDATCTLIEAGFACPISSSPCYMGACGDGTIEGPEACDDGNFTSGDGCDSLCLAIETHYACPIAGMSCVPICGDGVGISPETCDDGNTFALDGCDPTCKVEVGYSCPPAGGVCTAAAPVCGDGTTTGPETCDDGSGLNGSYGYCNATCDGPGPFCGDGIPQMPYEFCDDGVGGPCAADCQSAIPLPNGFLHIFETSGFTGDLGGNAGADALCMASPNRPNFATFKALLVDSTRHICNSSLCASGVAALDWVLLPSTTYYRGAQGSEVPFMTTDGNAIVTTFPLGGSLGGGVNFWLGMYPDWQANPQNCLNFTNATSSYSSPVGWDADITSSFFAGGSYTCDQTANLLCVEQ